MRTTSWIRTLRRLALLPLAVAGLASAAHATWSIILVDRSTGEVAIGCATCLENFDVQFWVPVMKVGIGGGCSQSSIDANGDIRRAIWDGLDAGGSSVATGTYLYRVQARDMATGRAATLVGKGPIVRR